MYCKELCFCLFRHVKRGLHIMQIRVLLWEHEHMRWKHKLATLNLYYHLSQSSRSRSCLWTSKSLQCILVTSCILWCLGADTSCRSRRLSWRSTCPCPLHTRHQVTKRTRITHCVTLPSRPRRVFMESHVGWLHRHRKQSVVLCNSKPTRTSGRNVWRGRYFHSRSQPTALQPTTPNNNHFAVCTGTDTGSRC